jgi:hypothetical protein
MVITSRYRAAGEVSGVRLSTFSRDRARLNERASERTKSPKVIDTSSSRLFHDRNIFHTPRLSRIIPETYLALSIRSHNKNLCKMVDSIAILPALSFLEQIDDLSNFLTRALPEAEKNQFLDSIRQLIESSAKTVTEQTEEGEETKQVMSEPSDEDKEKTVGKIVAVITEGHPGLEGTDRGESSAYLEPLN